MHYTQKQAVVGMFYCDFVFYFLKTWSCYAAQAGLQLLSFCLNLPNAKITIMPHCAQERASFRCFVAIIVLVCFLSFYLNFFIYYDHILNPPPELPSPSNFISLFCFLKKKKRKSKQTKKNNNKTKSTKTKNHRVCFAEPALKCA